MGRTTILLCLTLAIASSGCLSLARKAGREIERSAAKKKHLDVDPVDWKAAPTHPRLMATPDEWAGAKARSPADPRLKLLIARADQFINAEPITYSKTALLTQSRDALKRIPLYAGLYRLTGEPRFSEAGKRELLNVCNFPDWQPSAFLATAEMMTAVSIGYDWLYDTLSDDDRKLIARAIVDKGLNRSFDAYASGGGWTTAPHNWNLVCNGGLIVASLAVIDDDPDTARQVLGLAMKSITHGLATYDACEGGWPEGPMYHNYATRYAIFAAAALESGVEGRIELPSTGLKNAGNYQIQLTGPTGKSFNFGDGDEVIGNSAWMTWLGVRDYPAYLDFQRHRAADEPTVFDILWDKPILTRRVVPPLIARFPRAEIAVLRTTWDANATYLAIKGGDNGFNHTHLDLGTFVLDMLGERWACELGADHYDLPGYLGNRRGDYLRSSTAGQNTLTIGDANQPLDATAGIFAINEKDKAVTINLTGAYPGAKSVQRSARVHRDGRVSIVDEIELREPDTITWHFQTQALIQLRKDRVRLIQDGKSVDLIVKSPAEYKFQIVSHRTKPPQLPTFGVHDVQVVLPPTDRTTIEVEIVPAK